MRATPQAFAERQGKRQLPPPSRGRGQRPTKGQPPPALGGGQRPTKDQPWERSGLVATLLAVAATAFHAVVNDGQRRAVFHD